MNKLFKFEFKRLLSKKIIFFLPLILIAIGISGILLGSVYGNDLNEKVLLLNVFNAFTQFSFLFLSFIYISVLAEDFSKGNYKFLQQLGFSLGNSMMIKSLILYLISIVVADLFIIIYATIIAISDWSFVMLMVGTVDLGLLFIIFLSNILSIIFKRIMTATVISFVLYIIFDFINLVLFGLTNPCDANSISSVTLGQLAGLPLIHDSLSTLNLNYEQYSLVFTMLPSIIYCLVLFIVLYVLLKREEK